MANNGFSGGGGGDRFYESNLGKDVVDMLKQNSLMLFLFSKFFKTTILMVIPNGFCLFFVN